ncbi:MAG: hypothetical protein QM534_10525 [Sediminibacterium sp.]|nr:hypothetical protein [Sediminibacterium sp.]
MEKKSKKPLKEKLFVAINKVLKGDKTGVTKKTDKVVKKSIKRIVKKANQLQTTK